MPSNESFQHPGGDFDPILREGHASRTVLENVDAGLILKWRSVLKSDPPWVSGGAAAAVASDRDDGRRGGRRGRRRRRGHPDLSQPVGAVAVSLLGQLQVWSLSSLK